MKLLFIYNPKSCSGKSLVKVHEILSFFRKNNHTIDLYKTAGPEDAIKKTKKEKNNYDIIIAGGGDGTVNEVINGLASEKETPPRAKLGIIPFGTENVLAQELKITKNHIKACEKILNGKTIKADLGLAKVKEKIKEKVKEKTKEKTKKRYFILMAGVGFDAHVANIIEPKLKKLLGSTAYLWTGFKEILKYKPQKLTAKINGKSIEGYFAIVGNVKLYGGKIMPTHQADINDGFLDVCMLKSNDLLRSFKFIFGVLLKKHHTFPEVEYKKTKKVRIESDTPVLVHVDCEILGLTPVEIEVCHSAIEIVC